MMFIDTTTTSKEFMQLCLDRFGQEFHKKIIDPYLIDMVEGEFRSKHFSSGLWNDVTLNYDETNPTADDVDQSRKDIEEWVTKFLKDLEDRDELGARKSV
jgi:hypothetical protein